MFATLQKDLKGDSANFTISIYESGHTYFHIQLPVTRFYFPYMETSLQLIWIVMAPGRQCKFHTPSPPLVAPALHIYSYKACMCVAL